MNDKPGNDTKSLTPPYVTYATFSNYLKSLKDTGIPGRIDRTVLPGYSGGVQSQLLLCLRYFKLIDENGAPAPTLAEVVKNPKGHLTALLQSGYPFLIGNHSGFNLENASEGQITERFKANGVGGDTVRKCYLFFVAACADAGIALSPHIKTGKNGGSAPRRARRRKGSAEEGGGGGDDVHSAPPSVQGKATIEEKLIEKFPAFDPKWEADLQGKWFETFNKIYSSVKGKEESK